MLLRSCIKLSILALCVSCGGSNPPQPKVELQADPVDPGTLIVFTGQVFLEGSLGHETNGSIVVSVRFPATNVPVLQRSYEVSDPWRTGNSIQFGLSPADKVGEQLPVFARNMIVVARFDADGNPLTRGPGDVEAMTASKTGATDIAFVLRRQDPDLPQASVVGDK
ncbi:MAG: hypothetical protein JNL28_02395 [Planctomycetes bacterium]|nr:hypothetical protein [Planctomycetota bacterium]